MLVHFSCERMDDNIASFMTKGEIRQMVCAARDRQLHACRISIFTSPIRHTRPRNFTNRYKKAENQSRSDWFFNKTLAIFQSAARFRSKKESSSARAASTPKFFAPTENPTTVKKAKCASAPEFPQMRSFCFTPDAFRPKKTSVCWSRLMEISGAGFRQTIIVCSSPARDRRTNG